MRRLFLFVVPFWASIAQPPVLAFNGRAACNAGQLVNGIKRDRGKVLLSTTPDPGDEQRRRREYNLLESSPFDDQRPRRLGTDISSRATDHRNDWGLTRDHRKDLPSTADEVVDEAFLAIAGALYNKQSMDPNIASNAMSRSIFTQRPVRKKPDVGRVGVEIDGAEHLFREHSHMTTSQATRRLSILLAAKMSARESWEKFEADEDEHTVAAFRPVALCYSTIRQALAAGKELHRLKKEENAENGSECSVYAKIKIQCIQDGIPEEMYLDSNTRRRYAGLSNGVVNATKGIMMLVQPTDYHVEYPPPGPAVDAVYTFQQVVAQASVAEIPVVALSPRFLSNESPYGGWDQSGYQQSSIYGGLEPPKGPTPWVMRDFTPPVFCWVGRALQFGRPPPRVEEHVAQCHLSRLALTQSVMDPGHSWHIYAAKECSDGTQYLPTSYIYLGSTHSASGRPTQNVLRKIVEDY